MCELNDKTKKEIMKARKEYQEGRYITHAELKKILNNQTKSSGWSLRLTTLNQSFVNEISKLFFNKHCHDA